MSARKTFAATLVALSIMTPATGAFAQETVPEEGKWYRVEDAPKVAPKPACPKKPNRRENFVAMWKWERGAYTECRWDSQGAKPKAAVAYYSWGHASCSLASRQGVPYDICMAGGRRVTTTQFFSRGYQPTYEGFLPYDNGGYYSSGGGYYSAPPCPDTRAPSCYTMPPSATRVYPQSRPYRTPPPAPPPAQPTGPAKSPIYSCNGNGTAGCYDPVRTGN